MESAAGWRAISEISQSKYKPVLKYIQNDMKCCVICTLRLMNVSCDTLGSREIKDLASSANMKINSSIEFNCSLCWGIFPKLSVHNSSKVDGKEGLSILEKVRNIVKAEGYDLRTFFVNFQIPVMIDVRERAAYMHLAHKFPEVFPSLEMPSSSSSPPNKKRRRSSRTPKASTSHYFTYFKETVQVLASTRLERLLGLKAEKASPFSIRIEFSNSIQEESDKSLLEPIFDTITNEIMGDPDAVKKTGKKRNRTLFSRQTLTNVISYVDHDKYKKVGFAPPPTIVKEGKLLIETKVSHAQAYIKGRYLKLARGISQTPWILGKNERRFTTSVQELIANAAVPEFKCGSVKFHSGGREDADVRMLGNGRPFVLEMSQPHRLVEKSSIKKVEEKLNAEQKLIQVRNLELCDDGKAEIASLAVDAQYKRKQYRARVHTNKDLTEREIILLMKNWNEFKILQKTPIRVLHRRSNMVRPKEIHSLKLHKW
mmetsp:Transcript_9144/g.13710  ORF Transcript_9144/g.13710 Transcript_9144/m.13710 type:complete len:484 (+) Transcript_9144:45-1496(+)